MRKKHVSIHECNKNLSKEQKEKLVEYRRNYYIMHNKELLSCLIRFFFNNLRTIVFT